MMRRVLLWLALLPFAVSAAHIITLGSNVPAPAAEASSVGSVEFNLAADGEYNLRDIVINRNGTSADVGGGVFTVDLYIKAFSGNAEGTISRTNDTTWQFGNIILDADESFQGNGWGIALGDCDVAFGWNDEAIAFTLVYNGTSLCDSAWHLVSVEYDSSDGIGRLYLDGTLRDSQDTNAADINLSGLTPTDDCGEDSDIDCAPTDRSLVFGIEKGGFDNVDFPGFDGRIGWVRINITELYNGSNFTPPTTPPAVDANDVVYMLFGEQTGTTAGDDSGENNDGTLNVSGGWPAWNADHPWTGL